MTDTTRPDILALIPARGGSKGVPRKNVLPVAGRPLIAYSIDHALQSQHITRVIVSTDDDEIAAAGRDNGADVPFMRPAELAADLSPDIDAFRHALMWLADNEDYRPEMVVHLRATGPIRRVDLIDEAIDRMLDHPEADALRSVSWPDQTPYKMWRIDADDYLRPLLTIDGVPDSHSMPRQSLPAVYWQNGYVDIVRPCTILEKNSMTGQCVLPFIVNEPIFELDYQQDVAKLEEALGRLARGEPLTDDDPSDVTRHPV